MFRLCVSIANAFLGTERVSSGSLDVIPCCQARVVALLEGRL